MEKVRRQLPTRGSGRRTTLQAIPFASFKGSGAQGTRSFEGGVLDVTLRGRHVA